MIGKLYGTIDELATNYVIIKTSGGVGYKVFLPARSLSTLTANQEISLYTYTHIRENELSLFGFLAQEEEHIFNVLLGVSGVGPKTAMGILGFGQVEKLITAIKNQEVSYISSIPGIGKKTAQKILLELANKFNTEFDLAKTVTTQEDEEVISALMGLGFKRGEALTLLPKIPRTDSLEQKVTKALQLLERQ